MNLELKVRDVCGVTRSDQVAIEEPLQISIDGVAVAVVMRTPGNDVELVLGFLRTEAVVARLAEVKRIDLETRENHALVFLEDEHSVDLSRLSRNLFSASSCGICGKATIDAVRSEHPSITKPVAFCSDVLLQAPAKLRAAQQAFNVTGGLHAAGLFDRDGELLVVREDVGRHNAVDKVVGWAAADHQDLSQSFLLVSGRVSFEIMQKALAARIPLVAAISAPSSLAVEFASLSGQALVAFLRPPKLNLYAGALD